MWENYLSCLSMWPDLMAEFIRITTMLLNWTFCGFILSHLYHSNSWQVMQKPLDLSQVGHGFKWDFADIYSTRLSDAYMCQFRPSLFQIMVSYLFGTKPLPEQMLAYCQSHPEENYLKIKHFHLIKCTWKCCLQNGSHIVLASRC